MKHSPEYLCDLLLFRIRQLPVTTLNVSVEIPVELRFGIPIGSPTVDVREIDYIEKGLVTRLIREVLLSEKIRGN